MEKAWIDDWVHVDDNVMGSKLVASNTMGWGKLPRPFLSVKGLRAGHGCEILIGTSPRVLLGNGEVTLLL